MIKNKEQNKKVKIMEWPAKEDMNKSWGTAGYDRHYVGTKK